MGATVGARKANIISIMVMMIYAYSMKLYYSIVLQCSTS